MSKETGEIKVFVFENGLNVITKVIEKDGKILWQRPGVLSVAPPVQGSQDERISITPVIRFSLKTEYLDQPATIFLGTYTPDPEFIDAFEAFLANHAKIVNDSIIIPGTAANVKQAENITNINSVKGKANFKKR